MADLCANPPQKRADNPRSSQVGDCSATSCIQQECALKQGQRADAPAAALPPPHASDTRASPLAPSSPFSEGGETSFSRQCASGRFWGWSTSLVGVSSCRPKPWRRLGLQSSLRVFLKRPSLRAFELQASSWLP